MTPGRHSVFDRSWSERLDRTSPALSAAMVWGVATGARPTAAVSSDLAIAATLLPIQCGKYFNEKYESFQPYLHDEYNSRAALSRYLTTHEQCFVQTCPHAQMHQPGTRGLDEQRESMIYLRFKIPNMMPCSTKCRKYDRGQETELYL